MSDTAAGRWHDSFQAQPQAAIRGCTLSSSPLQRHDAPWVGISLEKCRQDLEANDKLEQRIAAVQRRKRKRVSPKGESLSRNMTQKAHHLLLTL